MTRSANARLAGFMFLFYIATGLTSLALFNRAIGDAEGIAAKLASLAQHAPLVRLTVVISVVTFVIAVVLGASLYALTREQDRDLALIALCCRLGEGVLAATSAVGTLGLLSVATASPAATPLEGAAAQALGALLLQQGSGSVVVAATCFAVGSLLFSWLFLRARSIPPALAWLGLTASALLVVLLPAILAGYLSGPVTTFMWLPMLVFEVTFALWLIIKGVAVPGTR